ncbi:hypothetical protein KSS87_008768 [Heliosperma pusillum]|nr:hypothetical protein KSS87_008768 [Heliosperma pusillum]
MFRFGGFSNLDCNSSENQCARTNVSFWRSSASYVRVDCGLGKFCGKPIVKELQKRAGIIRSATIEEIEAEKSMIEKDAVEYYGTPVELKTIANISTPDASSLLISPYDKSSLKSIEKAIVTSELGLNPNNDGEVIRLSIPPLTADRRKVAVRNIRRDALRAYEKLQKEKKLSEDNVKDLSADLQKLTDDYIKKVETIHKQKEQVWSYNFPPGC